MTTPATRDTGLKSSFSIQRELGKIYTGGPLAFRSSSDELVTTCDDAVLLVDLASSTVLHRMPILQGAILSLAVHPRGHELVLQARENTAMLCVFALPPNAASYSSPAVVAEEPADETAQSAVRSWRCLCGPIMELVYDATGELIASASADGIVRVWNSAGMYCTHNFTGHTGVVSVLAFHPIADKWQLFSGSDDNTIRRWDLLSSTCMAVLTGHMGPVTCLAFSEDATRLVSGSRDAVLMVWRTADHANLATLPVFENVESLVLLEGARASSAAGCDASCVAITVGDKGQLRVFDLASGACHRTAELAPGVKVPLTRALMRGHQLLVTSIESHIAVLAVPELSLSRLLIGCNDAVLDARFVDDNRIAVCTNSDLVKLYDLASGAVSVLAGHSDAVFAVAVSPDGAFIATTAKDMTVRLWDGASGACLGVGLGHADTISAVALAKRHGRFIVTGSKDKTIKLWPFGSAAASAAGAPAGTLSASLTERAHSKDISAVDVSPNDALVASCSLDKSIRLWSASDLAPVATLNGHKRGVWDVRFSPVDRVLASASSDRTVKLWSLGDYSCLRTLEGHAGSVLRVVFVSQGMQLLTGASDGIIKLFTCKSGECAFTAAKHADRIWALDVRANGDRLLSAGGDSTLVLWRDNTTELVAASASAREHVLLREQEIDNCLAAKQYARALFIAIELAHPDRARRTLESLVNEHGDASDAVLARTIRALQDAGHLEAFLNFVKAWNASARHALLAQRVLRVLFCTVRPEALLGLANISETLVALEPYSERHFARVERLRQDVSLLEYALERMAVLMPQADEPERGAKRRAGQEGDDDDEHAKKRSSTTSREHRA